MEDHINFVEAERPLDPDAVRQHVMRRPDAVEDPRGRAGLPWSLIVYHSEPGLASMTAGLRNDPTRPVTGVLVAAAEDGVIGVTFGHVSPANLVVARDICQWIMDSYEPRVVTEYGVDLTVTCGGESDVLFEPALAKR